MPNEIRRILLPLNCGQIIEPALDVGLRLARAFHAHLAAVLIGDDPNETATLAGEGLSGAMINDMIVNAEHEAQRRLLQTRLTFNQFLATHDVAWTGQDSSPAPAEDARVTTSLDSLSGSQLEQVTWLARLSDLTLIPHLESGDDPRASETLHAALFDSGRPVIIAPPTIPGTLGRRICIAWNGTAEAAVALRAILPCAREADAVSVLCSPDYQRRGPDGEKAVEYLARHGVNATLVRFTPQDCSVGMALLGACASFGADMLAMGAYSHSRLRQMILGGVTRHVLEHAPLTVMMTR